MWTGFQEMILQRIDIGGLSDNESFSLWAMAAARYPANAITDAMAVYVASCQRGDGSWRLGGISRPPFEDGVITHTAVAMRALQQYAWPARKDEFDQRVARARAFLLEAKAITTDDAAMQLAALGWAGLARDRLRVLAKALLARQHEDGGWSQTGRLASDAFATGQALWALRESGVLPASGAAYQRGVKYLLGTQGADGSWYVRSRSPKFQPYFQSGFPYDHDQWISSSATAWAVMALAPAAEREQRASR